MHDALKVGIDGAMAVAEECLATMGLSQRHIRAMRRAIIDSGASCTYVTGDVELHNAKAGGGHVWVANGQKEEVLETGELGPLSGVRKVESFERSAGV